MNKKTPDPHPLRAVAEAQLQQIPTTHSVARSAEELLHELHIHQIELEMQNENLRCAHIALEESRDRYQELYEFAPVGYLTLTHEGFIAESNLTAANLLRVERRTLLQRRFAAFITPKESNSWHLFFSNVIKQQQQQSIELTLICGDNSEISILLTCLPIIATNKYPLLRITLTVSAQRAQARAAHRESLEQLEKIASRIPGVVFQFKLSTDGRYSVPYSSKALYDIFKICPDDVREDATVIFKHIYAADYANVIFSIHQSAQNLSLWQCVFRVNFNDGSVHWLEGNASPEREADGSTLWHGFISDVTERQQTEEALRLSEVRYRSIIEDQNELICRYLPNGKLTFVNGAYARYYKKSPSELINTNFIPHIPDPDNSIVQKKLAEISPDNPQVNYSHRIITPDGEIRWQQWTQRGIYATDGRVIEYQAVGNDITEHKRAKFEKMQLWDVVNKSLNEIYMFDPQTLLFQNANEGAKQNLGYSLEQLRQLTPLDLKPDLSEQAFRELVAPLLNKQKKKIIFETTHRRANGTLYPVEVHLQLVERDGLSQFLSVINDISERKQAEAELRIAAIVFESQVGMTVTDASTKIIKVNQSFSRITGYSAEEVFNQKPRLLHSGRHDRRFYDGLWQTIRTSGVWQGEIWNKRKNGEIYPEWLTIAAVKNPAGVVTHYVATHIDITKRKQAEIELQQAKELAEAANQAKSEFLANMSHEIRTPMNAILGFSEVLNTLITDPTQHYYLDAIHRSGKTLLQLINDILDLSKIEAGRIDLVYEHINLKAIFDDIAIIFKQKLMEKGVQFSLEIPENFPACLVLDEIRFRQVLLNIVGNAVKFTDTGFIRLTVTLQPTASENYLNLIISITDSGMGIAEDQLESIFAAFTQQKQQNARYGGTGLGLTICKKLVEAMGGKLSVNSVVGEGSCFTIELPQVEICYAFNEVCSLSGKAKKPVATLANLNPFQPASVLIVDDIEINRHLIKTYLQDYPELQLIEAATGAEVLELVRQQHVDLILMDRRLRSESGDMVCKKIKELPNGVAIPIIMVTASILAAEEKQQPLFYEMQLSKPVNKVELITAMQAFLPIDESANITSEPLSKIPESIEEAVTAEMRQELLELLISTYQDPLKKLNDSGAFEISVIVEIAEQLLKLAEQYPCRLLANWATSLKNQAKLFDIPNLAITLKGFDMLLKNLEQMQ